MHLAATAPTQARALRRARLRGLAAGTVGCGMAAAAAWLLAASLTGPAPTPLPAPLPAFKPVAMPVSSSVPSSVSSPAQLPAPDAGLQAAVAEQPEAVLAAADSPAPAASLAAPLRAEHATASAAASVTTSPIAAPVEHAAARRHSYAEPVPARQVAVRSARAPVPYDAGDSADDYAGYSAGYRLAVPAYDASSRPSAVAYLPPDSHITLHEHSRLIDE
ncbi:hypothetical protein A9975_09510 [Cupriavidus sp. UME77]|nr:hypothetical protein [Cupriavidus sp. UME77]